MNRSAWQQALDERAARDPALGLAATLGGDAASPGLIAAMLLRECLESLYAVSDRRVAEARLSWWIAEAERVADGNAEHPLSAALPTSQAPLLRRMAGHALASLDQPIPEHCAAVIAQLRPLAATAAGMAPAQDWLAITAAHALRCRRHGGDGLPQLWPLDLLARHRLSRADLSQAQHPAASAFWRDHAGQLAALLPPPDPAAPRALRVLSSLERRYLKRVARSGFVDQQLRWSDVLSAWWAARGRA